MKACLLLRVLALGLGFAPCFTHAQTQIAPAVYRYTDPENSISCNVPLNEINIHAYRRFHRLFPSGTTAEYWFKSAEGYQVSFVQDALRHQAYFGLRGGFLYSLKYYAGAKMAGVPAELVRRKYPDYGIDVVTEITDGEKTFYLVKIINPASVKTLSVCEGKVELLEELVNGGSGAR
ncbi:MAG TPA: hypothetical protein VK518_17785 [Puia sp.]|nr:hypothetical protein [Puia sp.]